MNSAHLDALQKSNEILIKTNTERETLVTKLLQEQERINKEHALLKSEIMGEARLTMRSMRRANALIGLFFFSLITGIVVAIIGSRKK